MNILIDMFLKRKIIFFLLFSVLIFLRCQNGKQNYPKIENIDELEIIENSQTRVGVLPKFGGRIVLLQKNNSSNILKSDPKLWEHKFNKPVNDLFFNKIIPFYGHIVWVGPQDEWWIHQNINHSLKDSESRWPPDPNLIYGKFIVTEKEKNRIKMVGPKSQFTGVRLEKKIEILSNGKVRFEVTAENIRNENISWDLWLNTRIDGFNTVYVPVENVDNFRVEYRHNSISEEMPYSYDNGFFYFNPKKPIDDNMKISGKSFIYPSMNKIFAFTDEEIFIIGFEKYDRKLVHPNQAMIEIYNSIDAKGEGILELEYHTPYKLLKPGAKMMGEETWEVMHFRGDNSFNSHYNFITKFLEQDTK